ncbi:MAG: hypothetical protein G01um101418_899 [Parcubacteria group bacterium Gr01-1014_18]|nr:MAG: hypothetical protein Greene041636_938 [Parcubacteria group bacterium Greene0416_36]TSC79795.1 MAG: hypothetical protein G01um101418_899 [Parcubacteria group bacterium Gr01-1014_18]TSC98079.1 MAG: hypothetical protein Greene101420_908 [Parcubacteria group bacterium Greene1014_20]TSD06514.1 MAG: hypothetical protein Greene07142_857 [Parcubacteria group bacterium Greene0714_2]
MQFKQLHFESLFLGAITLALVFYFSSSVFAKDPIVFASSGTVPLLREEEFFEDQNKVFPETDFADEMKFMFLPYSQMEGNSVLRFLDREYRDLLTVGHLGDTALFRFRVNLYRDRLSKISFSEDEAFHLELWTRGLRDLFLIRFYLARNNIGSDDLIYREILEIWDAALPPLSDIIISGDSERIIRDSHGSFLAPLGFSIVLSDLLSVSEESGKYDFVEYLFLDDLARKFEGGEITESLAGSVRDYLAQWKASSWNIYFLDRYIGFLGSSRFGLLGRILEESADDPQFKILLDYLTKKTDWRLLNDLSSYLPTKQALAVMEIKNNDLERLAVDLSLGMVESWLDYTKDQGQIPPGAEWDWSWGSLFIIGILEGTKEFVAEKKDRASIDSLSAGIWRMWGKSWSKTKAADRSAILNRQIIGDPGEIRILFDLPAKSRLEYPDMWNASVRAASRFVIDNIEKIDHLDLLRAYEQKIFTDKRVLDQLLSVDSKLAKKIEDRKIALDPELSAKLEQIKEDDKAERARVLEILRDKARILQQTPPPTSL